MKNEMNGYDEEQIGRLLRLLPPAPEGWVRAAQELPAARAQLDELVARAEQDAAFRLQLRADLERRCRRRLRTLAVHRVPAAPAPRGG